MDITEEYIARRLQEVSGSLHTPENPIRPSYPSELLSGPARPAGVLVPFLRMDGAWHVLFTRRTSTLVEHSGQVAFPGGRSESDDPSPEITALREAHEEIGLDPREVKLLGRIDTFITNTNYLLTPVVGIIQWPFPLHLERTEVDRVFTIPLAWLAEPAHHEIRQRPMPPPCPPLPVIFFDLYDGETLWGVSAHIMVNLLNILIWA